VLLRGLRVAPAERHESMTALLAALARDPAVRRRRWLGVATGALALATVAAGAYRVSAGQHALCAGGPERAATAWGRDRRAALERAFSATGNKHAAQAFSVAAGLFDRYVASWTGMYKEACEATHVRGEQSADVLDLRMACLGERLSAVRAVTDVLASADAAVVDNAVNAASSLPALDRCADVAMLRAVVRPPDDPGTRQAVATVREEVAKVNALAMSGQCDAAAKVGPLVVNQAKALAYRPLEAEALYAVGRLGEACVDTTRAVSQLEEAAFTAQAANHDEIGLQAAIYLNLLYLDRVHDLRMGRYWTRHAEALSGRFSGHPRLDIWMLGAKSALLRADGRAEDALLEQRRALAKQEALLGKTHVDVAATLLNISLLLHELGRDAEAEPVIARAVELFTTLFGRDSARVAVAVLDEGEILTELGQFDRARADFEKALAIWRAGGASRFFIGFGLLDLGRLELAQGRTKEARATLEQAIADLGSEDASNVAQARFALAQALWSSPREQARALALARQARTALAAAPEDRLKLERIDGWLAARPSAAR
jgi:tetratricopeptide (TPR) repeat protein